MSTPEFLVPMKAISSHLQARLGDMMPEELEDVAIALFNVKTRIVTDEEDGRTFFEFSKVMSMDANSLFDQFTPEMQPFFSVDSAWYVDFDEGVGILKQALADAPPEFLSEVVADQYNVDAVPAESRDHLLVRQHASTPQTGDEVAVYFFKEAKKAMSEFIEDARPAARMGV
jgi:hypothetical protein